MSSEWRHDKASTFTGKELRRIRELIFAHRIDWHAFAVFAEREVEHEGRLGRSRGIGLR